MIRPGTINTVLDYDTQDHLISVPDSNSNTTTYEYDDAGRVMKLISPDTGTTRYTYDDAGNMTSKLDANGILVTYTYDALEEAYHYHPDHLGTLIFMTNSTGQKVWSAELLPFGEGYDINEDVDGDQVHVVNNLRFPGQYYDGETGLRYNVMRDYNSLIGRYIESVLLD